MVLDNTFDLTQNGITVINSGGNGGVIKNLAAGSAGGNTFNRNNISVVTFLPNQYLQIRCNTTNNPNTLPLEYLRNWDNPLTFLSPLGNQGLPANSTQITNPAGNRFNKFNNTTNKEIKNSYLSYTYYSHKFTVATQEFVPVNAGGVNVLPQAPTCTTFAVCCPFDDCFGPTPPPGCTVYPQRIGAFDQQIASLQIE